MKFNVYHGWRFQRCWKQDRSFTKMVQVEATTLKKAAEAVLRGTVYPESYGRGNRTFFMVADTMRVAYVWSTARVDRFAASYFSSVRVLQ